MESILPSEVARLVLGYLSDQDNCVPIARSFLEHSAHLSECRQLAQHKRFIQTEIHGYALEEILDEFCLLNSLIIEAAENRSIDLLPTSKVSENLKILLTNPHNESSASCEDSIRKRKRRKVSFPFSELDDICQNTNNTSFYTSPNTTILDDSQAAKSRQAKATPSKSPSVENQVTGSKSSKSPGSSTKRRSGTAATPSKLQSRVDNDVDDSMLDFSEILSRALDNKELHETLATSINKALTQETGTATVTATVSDRELDSVVRNVVNDTQSDPCFERFLDEIICQSAFATPPAGPPTASPAAPLTVPPDDEAARATSDSPQPPPLSRGRRAQTRKEAAGIKSRLRSSALTYNDIVAQATHESPTKAPCHVEPVHATVSYMLPPMEVNVDAADLAADLAADAADSLPPGQSRVTILPSLEDGLRNISTIKPFFVSSLANLAAGTPGMPSVNTIRRYKFTSDGLIKILPKPPPTPPAPRGRPKRAPRPPLPAAPRPKAASKAKSKAKSKAAKGRVRVARPQPNTQSPAKLSTITFLSSQPTSTSLPLLNSPLGGGLPNVRCINIQPPPPPAQLSLAASTIYVAPAPPANDLTFASLASQVTVAGGQMPTNHDPAIQPTVPVKSRPALVLYSQPAAFGNGEILDGEALGSAEPAAAMPNGSGIDYDNAVPSTSHEPTAGKDATAKPNRSAVPPLPSGLSLPTIDGSPSTSNAADGVAAPTSTGRTPRRAAVAVRKKCASTPRRGRPHIRALDFSTPPKRRGALTSPKVKQRTPPKVRFANRKALLFHSPEPIREEEEPAAAAAEAVPTLKPIVSSQEEINNAVESICGGGRCLDVSDEAIDGAATVVGDDSSVMAVMEASEILRKLLEGERDGDATEMEEKAIRGAISDTGLEPTTESPPQPPPPPETPSASNLRTVPAAESLVERREGREAASTRELAAKREANACLTPAEMSPLVLDRIDGSVAAQIKSYVAGRSVGAQIATRPPSSRLSSAWDRHTGVGQIIAAAESPEKRPAAGAWDAGLRALTTPSKMRTLDSDNESDCSCGPKLLSTDAETAREGLLLASLLAKTPAKTPSKTPQKTESKSKSKSKSTSKAKKKEKKTPPSKSKNKKKKKTPRKESSPRTSKNLSVIEERLASTCIEDSDTEVASPAAKKPASTAKDRSRRKARAAKRRGAVEKADGSSSDEAEVARKPAKKPRAKPKDKDKPAVVLSDTDVRLAAAMTERVAAILGKKVAREAAEDATLIIDEDADSRTSAPSSEFRLRLSSSEDDDVRTPTPAFGKSLTHADAAEPAKAPSTAEAAMPVVSSTPMKCVSKSEKASISVNAAMPSLSATPVKAASKLEKASTAANAAMPSISATPVKAASKSKKASTAANAAKAMPSISATPVKSASKSDEAPMTANAAMPLKSATLVKAASKSEKASTAANAAMPSISATPVKSASKSEEAPMTANAAMSLKSATLVKAASKSEKAPMTTNAEVPSISSTPVKAASKSEKASTSANAAMPSISETPVKAASKSEKAPITANAEMPSISSTPMKATSTSDKASTSVNAAMPPISATPMKAPSKSDKATTSVNDAKPSITLTPAKAASKSKKATVPVVDAKPAKATMAASPVSPAGVAKCAKATTESPAAEPKNKQKEFIEMARMQPLRRLSVPCLPTTTRKLKEVNELETSIVYADNGPKRSGPLPPGFDFTTWSQQLVVENDEGNDQMVNLSVAPMVTVFSVNMEPAVVENGGRKKEAAKRDYTRHRKRKIGGDEDVAGQKKQRPGTALDPQELLKSVDLDKFLDAVHADVIP